MHNPFRNKERYVMLGGVCRKTAEVLHDKEVFDFFVSSNTSYLEPNLFWAPIHLSRLDNGEYVYVIK